MKKIKLLSSAAMLLACSVITSQAQITLSYLNATSGSTAGQIDFLGNSTFNFTADSAGADFMITGGSANGDLGTISGTYIIGAVTTIFGVETAPVTGTGTVTINDGSGFSLTGTINWEDLLTVGTGGDLNVTALLNLTGVSYGGSQAALTALAGAGNASDTLSFNFNPAMDINALKTTAISDNFTGTITAVPEPITLISGGLLLLPLGASSLRILRRKRSI
jgi:hypothetical protein